MIFTWDSTNLCIIFRQWRVTGTLSLLMSLVAIVILTAGYEGLRRASARYEMSHEARMSAYSSAGSRTSLSLPNARCHWDPVKAKPLKKKAQAHGWL